MVPAVRALHDCNGGDFEQAAAIASANDGAGAAGGAGGGRAVAAPAVAFGGGRSTTGARPRPAAPMPGSAFAACGLARCDGCARPCDCVARCGVPPAVVAPLAGVAPADVSLARRCVGVESDGLDGELFASFSRDMVAIGAFRAHCRGNARTTLQVAAALPKGCASARAWWWWPFPPVFEPLERQTLNSAITQ